MQASYRFGDAASADAYPLCVDAGLAWRECAGGVCCEIPLPPCPAGHIIVPSLSVPEVRFSYQAALKAGDTCWQLQPVPSARTAGANGDGGRRCHLRAAPTGFPQELCESSGCPPAAPSSSVSTQIDCFHTEADVPASRLIFHLRQPTPPPRYLAVLSVRPLRMAPPTPRQRTVRATTPTCISQMEGPPDIRGRICSPTALAMMLQAEDPKASWPEVVAQCFDEHTQAYGCWPLAIRCAAAYGRVGAVEALASWDPALAVLRAGLPIVASIDFGPEELPGAPLTKTGGHLVTCYGMDREAVLVHDPAAENAAAVPRRYDLAAFSKSWLGRRGAAYILGRP